jgi:hypothetical protein
MIHMIAYDNGITTGMNHLRIIYLEFLDKTID